LRRRVAMTITTAMPAPLDAKRYERPARDRHSPRLAAVIEELQGYIRRQPDVTLGELRAAFIGTGFIWGADGRLAFSPSRRILIEESDELIERHGGGAQGAELFLQ